MQIKRIFLFLIILPYNSVTCTTVLMKNCSINIILFNPVSESLIFNSKILKNSEKLTLEKLR